MTSTTSPSARGHAGSAGKSLTSQSGRRDGGKRKVRVYRLVLLVVFLIAVISLVVLTLVRKSVEVEASVRVRRLSFQSLDGGAGRLFNSVNANSVTLSRFERVDLGKGRVQLSQQTDPKTGKPIEWKEVRPLGTNDQYITTEEAFGNITFEDVTLNQMVITPGTRATLSWDEDEPDSVKISFDRAVSGDIAAGRKMEFSCNGCRLLGSPDVPGAPAVSGLLTSSLEGQVISFRGQNESTIVSLNLAPKTALKEHSIPTSDKLDFSRLIDGHLVSSLIAGTIQFQTSEGPIVLSEGTLLDLGSVQHAVIKTISIDGGINVVLSGRTDTLLSGTEGNLQNRAPSVLEWVYSQHKWLLVLQTLTLIIPVALVVLTWFGVLPKKLQV